MIEWGLVATLTAVLVVWLVLSTTADRANNLVYDSLIRMEVGIPDDDIVLISVDNRSLQALGRWPWPRSIHAALIDKLTEAEPLAVAYDILFIDPSSEDQTLAAALSRSKSVYLPLLVDAPGQNGTPWDLGTPPEQIATSAAGLGHINLTVDRDGVIRFLPLYMQAGHHVWPQLILPLAATRTRLPLPVSNEINSDVLFASRIKAITYRGVPGQFRTLSFVDVLNGEVPRDFLKNRLVLVGATAPGLGDRYATPASPEGDLTPGLEIQAALLQTLLDGGGPRKLAKSWTLPLSLFPLAILVCGFLFLRPLWNMILGASLIALTFIASMFLFRLANIWFPPAAAMAGLALAYPLWSWRRLATASAYMQSEVEAFERAGLAGSVAGIPIKASTGDIVARQVEALRAALKRLRDLDRFISDTLRSLPDATVVSDLSGRIVLSNHKARNLFGEDLDNKVSLEDLFQTLGEPSWHRFITNDVQDQGEICAPDGRVLKAAAASLTDASGQETGHIVRFADLTLFRAAERQREQALQLLSHDMRAPQVSILTLLEGDLPRSSPSFEQRIARYARQTLELAEGYVQLARAETQPYRSIVVDLGQLLLEAADTLWPQAAAAGVTIRTPDPDQEYLVAGDPALLRRMIMNLLDNALKYGPVGSFVTGSLEFGPDEAKVCVLKIADEGPGLSSEATRRLFQPFGHGDGDHRGSGLGLAFVRTVAERHGGTVAYEAGKQGATFIVTLPCTTESD